MRSYTSTYSSLSSAQCCPQDIYLSGLYGHTYHLLGLLLTFCLPCQVPPSRGSTWKPFPFLLLLRF